MTDIKRLRELEAKATPAMWQTSDQGHIWVHGEGTDTAINGSGELIPVQVQVQELIGQVSKADDAYLIAELRNSLPSLLDELEAARNAYHELLYAVGNRYEGETRHQTALRYIREHESRTEGPCSAHAAAGKGGGR